MPSDAPAAAHAGKQHRIHSANRDCSSPLVRYINVNTYTSTARPRRRGWARYLMLALLVVPILEVYVILKVGQTIGGWNTFALLLLWSGLGAWLVKRESGRAFGALKQAFATGKMPARELADAALVLVGGTLLLAPGFLTDVVGLFFIIPLTRPITRRVLERAVQARMFGVVNDRFSMFSFTTGSAGPTGASSQRLRTEDVYGQQPYPYPHTSSTSRGDDGVIEGEIVD